MGNFLKKRSKWGQVARENNLAPCEITTIGWGSSHSKNPNT
jgi:hypothetical protein